MGLSEKYPELFFDGDWRKKYYDLKEAIKPKTKKLILEFVEKLKKLELRCVGSGSQYWQNRIIELQIEYQEKLK